MRLVGKLNEEKPDRKLYISFTTRNITDARICLSMDTLRLMEEELMGFPILPQQLK